MKIRQTNIFVLAIFHLVLLLTPFGAKLSHHHASEKNHFIKFCTEKTLSQTEESCLVCQFEFVNIITSQTKPDYSIQSNKIIREFELISPELKISFAYFSHRAPPLS